MSEAETFSDAITEGVRVSVQSEYLPSQSNPQTGRFVFGYQVRIANESASTPVQLRTRHWIITDQLGEVEEVKGPGVVGEEPLLEPGQAFEYGSGAILTTPRGVMHGTYQMELPDGTIFDAEVAPFALAMPFSLN